MDRTLANYSFGEYSELRRREAVAFNGTYMHELYFENLNKLFTSTSNQIENLIKKLISNGEIKG